MRPFRHLLPREEAMTIIESNITGIDRVERINLAEAEKRVLAGDVLAGFNVPPFDRASMDGYAVKAENTYGASSFSPRRLKLVGIQHAGETFEDVITNGECLQVATGSPIPMGSDAVVMVEYTRLDGNVVEVQRPVYPGANISPEGEDIIQGEAVVKDSEIITPGKIGALAALGLESVEVYSKPRVAVFSTGSEVKPIGSRLEPGQIYDINSYTLSAVIASNGCTQFRLGIIPDDRDALRSALEESVGFDLAIFSGGSSVGSSDLFSEIVGELGEVLFHGVQVKPGKPTLFGVVEGKPIFGMPGYPTSCLSNAYIFLVPALRRMARYPPYIPRRVKAEMASRIVSSSGREQFLTVRLEGGLAYPVFKKSGAITSMTRADGYVILPVNADTLEEGEEVTVTLFG